MPHPRRLDGGAAGSSLGDDTMVHGPIERTTADFSEKTQVKAGQK